MRGKKKCSVKVHNGRENREQCRLFISQHATTSCPRNICKFQIRTHPDDPFTYDLQHWGIFMITEAPKGQVYSANNKDKVSLSGDWSMHTREILNPFKSGTLLLLYRLGNITPSTARLCDSVLKNVPCDGKSSARNGEKFTCRTWVKDAVVKLHEARVIKLAKDIGKFLVNMDVPCGYIWLKIHHCRHDRG